MILLHGIVICYYFFCIMTDLAPHALHHIALGSYTLDHAEPEFKEPTEQAQVKEFINLSLDQGKSGASKQCSLYFILNLSLC
jgi:hypothetical protein